jgi:hypothetical protein
MAVDYTQKPVIRCTHILKQETEDNASLWIGVDCEDGHFICVSRHGNRLSVVQITRKEYANLKEAK